jgi:hypothetical protein
MQASVLRIELRRNLVAMLSATVQSKRSPETGDLLLQIALVAGAGFEPLPPYVAITSNCS